MQRLLNGEIRRHAGSRFSRDRCHEWLLLAESSGDVSDVGSGGGDAAVDSSAALVPVG